MINRILCAAALVASSFSTTGCVLAAGAAAGAIAADELNEDDGEFDPLEEAYDGDKGTTPIIDDDVDN
ncbi:MAG: hypothetical protein AB7F91_08135 [Parvularculaceae bacterium]|nr:hypothetical protein [Parvularculaceae bacterium]